MLKKFLPKLRKRPTQSQNQDPQNQDRSPDLLASYNEEFAPVSSSDSSLRVFLKFVTVVVLLAFTVVWFLNKLADRRIDNLQSGVDALVTQNFSLREVEIEANKLMNKIDFYKKVEAERRLFGEDLEQVIELVPSGVEITGIKYDEGVVSLKAQAESALIFSLLISRYFEADLVSEIILRSAELQASRNVFNVEMGLILK